jgi:hypothetical protein
MSNQHEPAFPHIDSVCGTLPDGDRLRTGLTKRELFAAMAKQGYLAMYAGIDVAAPTPTNAAQAAVEYADALLAALAK